MLNYSPLPWAQLAADQILIVVADGDPLFAVKLRSSRMRVRQAILPAFRSISGDTVPADLAVTAYSQLLSSMQQTSWAAAFEQHADAVTAVIAESLSTGKDALA